MKRPRRSHLLSFLPALALLSSASVNAAAVGWDNDSGDYFWGTGANWSTNALPGVGDDLTFGTGTPGMIFLNGNRTAVSTTFSDNFILGALGTNNGLTAGPITVASGKFAQINAALTGSAGLVLSGGGSLYITNPGSTYTGDITVNGAGTTLVHRSEGVLNQYNGINSVQEFSRNDQVSLGLTTVVRNINLTNGGTYKIIGAGNNSEGNFKNIIIGTGGGTVNIAPGQMLLNLDDVGQITATTNAFTKAGNGRLSITGNAALAAANPLGGIVNVDDGILSLDSSVSQTIGANAYVRTLGIAATGTTLNVNAGGTFMLNGGAATFDVPTINLNNGSIFAPNGADHNIGYSVAGAGGAAAGAFTVTTMNISGTTQFLTRDLFAPQTARLPRLRAVLTGTGTIELLGGTAAGSTSRIVIERGVGSTFSGTFRLTELTSLEANPRNNAIGDYGKVIADGDVDFAGWGSTLDIRDSNNAAASVFDYTTNEIGVSSTQVGGINAISVTRATTASGTGHMFNFGTLTLGDHRIGVTGNNGYQVGLADTAVISGNAIIEMRGDGTPLVLNNAVALTETAAGKSLTIVKTGVGSSGARDVISTGGISISNLNVSSGSLILRGANGRIGAGFGGAAPTITINGGTTGSTTGPTGGLLLLDGSTGHVVGATTVAAAANNNDRVDDNATLILRGNSIVRLTSANGVGTTETLGTTFVNGHTLFDVVKTGTSTTPVVLNLPTLLMGNNATLNLTGTSLGVAGANTSRIVISGTPTGIMGAQYHSGNEWAKYSSAIDNGFELGATPFLTADYTVDATAVDTAWAAGQQLKLTSATGVVMSANRNVARLNTQLSAANQAVNLAGFVLNLDQGGILTSTNTIGIVDGATGAAPSGTGGISAGTTSAAAQLYIHTNATVDLRAPIRDNAAGGVVDVVKSGTGTLRMIHQGLGVAGGATAISPFTATPWQSTFTGSFVINDGLVETARGEFLNGRPIIMNGGALFINQPVSIANSASILPNYGNNVTINGNASLVADDNGESLDGNAGGGALISLGSLTINNGSTLSTGAYANGNAAIVAAGFYVNGAEDFYFPNGTTINDAKATINTGVARSGTTSTLVLGGAVTGRGFDMVGFSGSGTVELGGGAADTVPNTYSDPLINYAGILRMNKANGTTAIVDTTATEDVVINGGSLFWGPGDHGNLTTNNNINTTNNGLTGIAPTSPAAIFNAGQNQIPDTANITLLTGIVGESDRISNEKFNNYIQKNGTLNIGLGTLEMNTATISGGAIGYDRGGSWKVGTLTYLVGAPDQNVFTGRPVPGAYTTLEIGSGGVTMNGQFMTIGSGFYNNNVAGAGGRIKLGGNLTYNATDSIGGSYSRKGLYVQTGSSFRQLGDSHIDLMGGTRDFNITQGDANFTSTLPLRNGGITKSGNGQLILEAYTPSSYSGGTTINAGSISARSNGSLGLGPVTVNSTGTVKLDSGWTYGNNFTVTGQGSALAGEPNLRELGAVVAETGTSRINGSFTLGGNATVAGSTILDPSTTPATGGSAYRIGKLVIASAGGVTGTGTLSISGNGDGAILNGLNTSSGGLYKEGAGRWVLGGVSSYAGSTTIAAGALQINNGAGLGSSATGTTVAGGSLELVGGISTAEPLKLYDHGFGGAVVTGSVINVSGSNTLTGAITLGGDTTLRTNNGTLNLGTGANVSAAGYSLTLNGPGAGTIASNVNLGTTISGDALTKNGTGAWTVSGNMSYVGDTRINGGSLTMTGSAILPDATVLKMGGGSFFGNAAVDITGLNLLAGGGTVGGGLGLGVGAISRSLGATANFTGVVNTFDSNTNGLLGGWATYGNDFATVDGSGNLAAYAAYSSFPVTTVSNLNNYATSVAQYRGAAESYNSLKISDGAGLVLGLNNLTLASGALMNNSSVIGGITGTGILAGATAADDLIIYNNGATFDVAIPLIGAGAGNLVKSGNGRVILSGASAFTGGVFINGGTLGIVGPGGTTHPTALGSAAGPRNININGGTFELVGGDFDASVNTMQFVIGSAGGTIRSTMGANVTINDLTQLSGSGDLTFTGGARFLLNAATNYNFTGGVTLDGGIMTLGNGANTSYNVMGTRPEQTIRLKAGSALINQVTFGLGGNGLINNIIAEGGAELYALGGNRVYSGDIQFNGTNTIALVERDTHAQERQMYLNGRVSGTGVTLNVFGARFDQPLYLTSGANDLTGTINLGANATLEARGPGSLGVGTGDVTLNLNGVNSRLLMRHWQNGDFRANVNVNNTGEINSSQLAGYAGGTQQILSINNLTVNGDNTILTIGGGSNYLTRVAGTATLNASATASNILNVVSSDLILENGLTLGSPASTVDKRGAFSVIQRGTSNQTGNLILQQSLWVLQDGGTLPSVGAIQLRGGELRIDNSAVTNTDRVNNAAAISLGGGVLRVTGDETFGTITAASGTTQIISNPINETVPNPLTLTGFTRQTGAVVQFQSPDSGQTTVGQTTFGVTRVSSRIYIPGQADVVGTTNTIPGLLGNNNLDFIQYDGTTMDSGFALGVRDMRNPGSLTSQHAVGYVNDTAETGWTENLIHRSGTARTDTLTANRALDAWKIEAAITLTQGAFNLRIENGGILPVAATTFNGTGKLYAGRSTATSGVAELFIGGSNTLNINSVISDNPESGQTVALVKTGTSTLNLNGTVANTYSGGTYVDSGVINTTVNNAFGAASNPIYLAGGTLQFNIGNASAAGTGGALGGLGHNVGVLANSTIILDNGAGTNTDMDLALGNLTINGPYTLGLRAFDSMDLSFTGTHNLTGTPTLDMQQVTSGSLSSAAATTSIVTINGAITGTGGYRIDSTGNVTVTAPYLQIGGGATDTAANTNAGKVTVLQPASNFASQTLIVQLNKAAGVNAIAGDLEINGGVVRNLAANQIVDTSNIVINQGQYDANGFSETFASLTMNGGNFRTSSPGTGGSTVTITGDVNAIGLDDATGSVDGVATNSNTTLVIGGTLRLNGYSKGTIGGTASTMVVGGLEMTGTSLTQGGAGSTLRLNGDVNILANANVARIGATSTVGAKVELNGTRIFNVADGTAGIDLAISTALTDSTSPVAVGHFVKNGPGTVQLEGSATVNSYTGTTTINEGNVILFKNGSINALPAGNITIGSGTGTARVTNRNSNQIADAASVTINANGTFDLEEFNTSETVARVMGSGKVNIGPGSLLTVNSTVDGTFSGNIQGAGGTGGVTKAGTNTWTLGGTNTYSGTTTVSGGTLLLASDTALSSGANVTLSGGKINTGGFDGTTSGSLSLTANSVIDFASTTSILSFANNTTGTWTGLLSIWNWNGLPWTTSSGGTEQLNFTNSTLTAGQLATINFYSDSGTSLIGPGGADFLSGSNGQLVPVPEPTAIASLLALLGLAGYKERRRFFHFRK